MSETSGTRALRFLEQLILISLLCGKSVIKSVSLHDAEENKVFRPGVGNSGTQRDNHWLLNASNMENCIY